MIGPNARTRALPGYPLAKIPSIKRRLMEAGVDVIDLPGLRVRRVPLLGADRDGEDQRGQRADEWSGIHGISLRQT